MRRPLFQLLGIAALFAMLLPVTFAPAAAQQATDQVVDIDVSVNGGAFIDPDDLPGRTVRNVCRGAIVDVRFTVGDFGADTGDLQYRFQGYGDPPRQEFLGVVGDLPEGVSLEETGDSLVTFTGVQTNDVITIQMSNNRGYNTTEGSITGVPAGGTNEFEIDTAEFDCPDEGPGPGPGPSPCPEGGVTKRITGIDLDADDGMTEFFSPEELAGPGNDPEGSRVTVQLPGGNVVTSVQQGELVRNRIFINGINPADHPRIVIKDRFQTSYQQVVAVAATNGAVATELTSAPNLGDASFTEFSYYVSGGQVFVYNVPATGDMFEDVLLWTEITAERGYITNNVELAGELIAGKGWIVKIGGVCRDSAETAIFDLGDEDPFLNGDNGNEED